MSTDAGAFRWHVHRTVRRKPTTKKRRCWKRPRPASWPRRARSARPSSARSTQIPRWTCPMNGARRVIWSAIWIARRLGQRAANDTLARAGEMAVNGAVSGIQNLNAPLQAPRYATGEDHSRRAAAGRSEQRRKARKHGHAHRHETQRSATTCSSCRRAGAEARPRRPPATQPLKAQRWSQALAAKVVDAGGDSQPSAEAAIEASPPRIWA